MSFIHLQRSDRQHGMELCIDLTQIESFTPGEEDETIISMRSGQSWHVRGNMADVIDKCFARNKAILRDMPITHL